MNGFVIPDTPIAVDFWRVRECPTAKLFFLSHMHADHTCGLSSTWSQPIYCSAISKKLLQHKFQVRSSLIHALEVNASHIIPVSEYGQESMTVSLINAHHCPGAVMFLFQGYFGNILYTGDFRYTPDMFVDTPLSNSVSIDVLYLDNTYCDPGCVFPSREEAKQEIFSIIETHPCHNVVLGVHSLGKEDLMVDIARTFKTRIFVNQTRYAMLEMLNMPDVFSMDENQCFVHILMKQRVTKKNMEKWNKNKATIAILPTALFTGINGEPYANMDDVFIVKYSDHSSYTELLEFVARLKPKSVVPIVKGASHGPFGVSLKHRASMTCFNQYLSGTKPQDFDIPLTVRQFMCGNVNNLMHQTGNHCKRYTKIKHHRSTSKVKTAAPKGVWYDSPAKDMQQTVKCPSQVEVRTLPDAVTKTIAVVLGEHAEKTPSGNQAGECVSRNANPDQLELTTTETCETQGMNSSGGTMCKGDSESGKMGNSMENSERDLLVVSDSDSSFREEDKMPEHRSSTLYQDVSHVDNDLDVIFTADDNDTDGTLNQKSILSDLSCDHMTSRSEKLTVFSAQGKSDMKESYHTVKQQKLSLKYKTIGDHNEEDEKNKTRKRKLPLTFTALSHQHKKLTAEGNLHYKSFKRIQKMQERDWCAERVRAKKTDATKKLMGILGRVKHPIIGDIEHRLTAHARKASLIKKGVNDSISAERHYGTEKEHSGTYDGDCFIEDANFDKLQQVATKTEGKDSCGERMCNGNREAESDKRDFLVVTELDSFFRVDKNPGRHSSTLKQNVALVDYDPDVIFIGYGNDAGGTLNQKNISPDLSCVHMTSRPKKIPDFFLERNGNNTEKNSPIMGQKKQDEYLSEQKYPTTSDHEKRENKIAKRKLPLTFQVSSHQHEKLTEENNLSNRSHHRTRKMQENHCCDQNKKSKRTDASKKLLGMLGTKATIGKNQQ